METAYSILMSVYAKESSRFLEKAIFSMLHQTIRTDDFVIVCDGPLTQELDDVLECYSRENPGLFHIVRLPRNVGIGAAANAGLHVCKNDLVAKMDADDIALPNRCELQLNRFTQNGKLAIIGTNIEEFDKDPARPFALRCVPEHNEMIRKFARRRQPFNNQTVMYRKNAVLAVGGYSNLPRNEDYDLYIRMLAAGYEAENLPQPLVKVRVDRDAAHRRASLATLKGCFCSRWRAYRIGYTSLWDFIYCITGQFVIFICPYQLQNLIYSKLLRRACPEKQSMEDS